MSFKSGMEKQWINICAMKYDSAVKHTHTHTQVQVKTGEIQVKSTI